MKRLSVLVMSMLLLSGVAFAEDTGTPMLTPSQIAERYSPAVVLIVGLDANKQAVVLGTGFLVTPSGVLVTNYHVVQGVYPAQVKLASGDVFDSLSVIDTDERKDIAVLKVKGFNLPAVTLGDSDAVKPGDKVTVIGNPKGLEGSVTDGLVSAVRDIKDILPSQEGYKVMQISAAISPGSSGSPVFNECGRVVGIATATLKDGQNLNFAIPINYGRGMISEKEKMSLEEFSKTSKPVLIGGSAATVQLDDDEWGKRMAPLIRKVLDGDDWFEYGEWETRSPHSKGFKADRFSISSGLYTARDKLLSAVQELALFCPRNPELAPHQDRWSKYAEKQSEGYKQYIELLKTIPSKGFSEFIVKSGEIIAVIIAADDFLHEEGALSWAEVYRKYCPKQMSLLPLQLRQTDEFAQAPVRLGFRAWATRDDVAICTVETGGAAEKAGFKPLDCIIGVEKGVRFKTWDDWWPFMRTKKPGDEVKFEVLRDGKRKILKAKLVAREAT